MMLRPMLRLASIVVLLMLGLASCTEGLAFRQDRRLQILAPEELSNVSLPVELRWLIEDFEVTGPDGQASPRAGYFGIFVDRSPMAPGKGLEDLVRDDEHCLRTPGCPDAQYLRDRNVFLTTDTAFTIEGLRDTRSQGRTVVADSHEVVIVLLDGTSHRIGESVFSVRFFVDRSARTYSDG